MTCHTKEELERMLYDVVAELDLSDAMLEKHGPHGTEPAILVREALAQKDMQISMLRQGFREIGNNGQLEQPCRTVELAMPDKRSGGKMKYLFVTDPCESRSLLELTKRYLPDVYFGIGQENGEQIGIEETITKDLIFCEKANVSVMKIRSDQPDHIRGTTIDVLVCLVPKESLSDYFCRVILPLRIEKTFVWFQVK